MEAETTPRSAALEMDKGLTSVMPETWAGHARIKIRDEMDLSEELEEQAIEVAERVLTKKDKAPATKVAELVVEKLQNA